MKKSLLKISILTLTISLFTCCKTNAQSNNNNTERGQGGQGDRQGGPPSADEIFAKMDTNKDNLLAENEIDGPLKDDFAKVDSDGDGYISREELENAPKPERKGPPGGGER